MHDPEPRKTPDLSQTPQTPQGPARANLPSGWAQWQAIAQGALIVVAVIALTVVLVGRIHTAQRAVQATQPIISISGTPSGTPRSEVTWALVGQAAPDFSIQTYTWRGAPSTLSQTLHLAALRGRPVVINFWASWCEDCHAEASLLEQTWQHYKSQGVVFLGLDFDDDQPDAVAFLQQYGITYLNGPDATQEIAVHYAVPGMPATIFIDRHGLIAGRHLGALDQPTLDRAIAALL